MSYHIFQTFNCLCFKVVTRISFEVKLLWNHTCNHSEIESCNFKVTCNLLVIKKFLLQMLVCDLCLLNPAILVICGLSGILRSLWRILLSYLVHMHSSLRSLRQGKVHVGPITWEVLQQGGVGCFSPPPPFISPGRLFACWSPSASLSLWPFPWAHLRPGRLIDLGSLGCCDPRAMNWGKFPPLSFPDPFLGLKIFSHSPFVAGLSSPIRMLCHHP
jgi:hypothetical protein